MRGVAMIEVASPDEARHAGDLPQRIEQQDLAQALDAAYALNTSRNTSGLRLVAQQA